MSIQWFPGHMAKARRLLEENVKLVDVVVELRDARVPLSSENPLFREIIGNKQRCLALTKIDLADPGVTAKFCGLFARQGIEAVALDTRQRKGVKELLVKVRALAEGKIPRDRASGKPLRPVRLMIAGIPNVGKSSLINALSNRAAAKTGALPGLTRAKQWIRLKDGLELLDTPGLLWPRIEDPEVAFRLAVTGAVGTGGYDNFELASALIEFLAKHYPELLRQRYNMDFTAEDNGHKLLALLGVRRGCLIAGGEIDFERATNLLLQEYREGTIGRISLDEVK